MQVIMATTSIDNTNIVFDNVVKNDVNQEQLISKYNLYNPVIFNDFEKFYELVDEIGIVCSFNDANLKFLYALIDENERCIVFFSLLQ